MSILGICSSLYGIKETLSGTLKAAQGKTLSGVKRLCLGFANLSAGAALLEYSQQHRGTLLRCALLSNGLSVAGAGLQRMFSVREPLQEAIQTFAGICFSAWVLTLDSHVLNRAQQVAPLALASSSIFCGGVQDLTHQKYSNGVLKVVTGAIGVFLSGYYLYGQFYSQEPLPIELQTRLKTYAKDIEPTRIREDFENCKTKIGDLHLIGRGVSKCAYANRDFNYVMKLPNTAMSKAGSSHHELLKEYHNQQEAHSLIAEHNLTQIVIPKFFYAKLGTLPIIFSEKLDLVDFQTAKTWANTQTALQQLEKFRQHFGSCDLEIRLNHNVAFLRDSESDPMIGIYDLDCGFS